MKMSLKRIFPIEVNFIIKNFFAFFKRKNIECSLNERKTIFYLDAPSYNNLGDQAIALAMEKFIKDNFSNYNFVEISEKDIERNLKYLKKKIKEHDIIVLSGGGNFGDLYPRFEAIRRVIIKNFANKIIIFPQTFYYSDTKYGERELKRSLKIYNKKNVYLCSRENKSYNLMKKMYKNVVLVPDIVFYLNKICQSKKEKSKKSNIVGICLRNDSESTFDIAEREKLSNLINSKYKTYYLDMMSNEKKIDCTNREKILMKKMDEFKKCDLIITDRLHGMIFSILNSKPCLFIDNSNKKVSGVFNLIKSKLANIYNISDLNNEEIMKLIDENINKESNLCTDNLYDELFNLLND